MKTKFCYFEIVVVLLLSVIPWPGPSVFKISCPRDRASMVRRIVHKRWIPILKKYQVELPLECPFHESRDIFYPQQVAKIQHRTSQWTCGLCGKSFYAEKHLDAHFDSRHRSNVNTAEDAVCLANYCDIMRCDVLGMMELDGSLVDDSTGTVNTDIQVWRENTDSRVTPYVPCECRELARVYSSNVGNSDKSEIISTSSSFHRAHTKHCQTSERATSQTGSSTSTTTASSSGYHRDIPHDTDNKSSACDNDDNEGENDTSNLVEAALPSAGDRREKNRESEIRKLKSNCNPEELQKLKIQCEILVRDCIAGLLANLSIKDFQEIEGELNRAICWYLSCDRYWEDTKRHQRHTPWYLLVTFLFLLSSGISACYYVVSLLLSSGDDDCMDGSEDNPEFHDGPDRPSSSLHDPGGDGQSGERRKYEDEDRLIAAGAMPDHYIYVAYPPELKRRLLESCYNRTTRL